MGLELYSVQLRTADWERLVDWYREVLGLKVLLRVVEDRYALLSCGNSRLAVIEDRRLDPAADGDRATLIFEVSQLAPYEERLGRHGVSVARRQNPEGFQQLSLSDPDGNPLRLICWPKAPG